MANFDERKIPLEDRFSRPLRLRPIDDPFSASETARFLPLEDRFSRPLKVRPIGDPPLASIGDLAAPPKKGVT